MSDAKVRESWSWEGKDPATDYIGECTYLGGTLVMLADTYEDCQPDLCLIAAAPELLAACMAAMDALGWKDFEGTDRHKSSDELYAICKAAVHKATHVEEEADDG